MRDPAPGNFLSNSLPGQHSGYGNRPLAQLLFPPLSYVHLLVHVLVPPNGQTRDLQMRMSPKYIGLSPVAHKRYMRDPGPAGQHNLVPHTFCWTCLSPNWNPPIGSASNMGWDDTLISLLTSALDPSAGLISKDATRHTCILGQCLTLDISQG